MSLVFDPTIGELVDEAIIDTLPDSRRRAILSLLNPNLLFFNVDKQIALDNEDVTFSWKVQFAKKVKLIYARNRQEIPEQGSLSLSLLNDTEVKLSYESFNGTKFESEIIKVKVYPAPLIQFDISELKIEIGGSTKINWIVKNSTKVRLYNGYEESEVSESGELEAKPFFNTTYKLIITALDNSSIIEKELTVEVFEKPKINFFNAEPDVVLDYVPVNLSWNVENAKKVVIDNGIGEVELVGSKKTLLLKNKTFFTLTAYGELSNCKQDVAVRILPTPIIESLKIPMPDFTSRFSLSSVALNPPNINVSINLPDFNLNIPEYVTPNIPLNRIKPEYKPKMSIFNFSKLYERIRKRSKI
jgi:hypothetical protein